jgi:excinuclease ABC subunit C
MTTEDFKEMSHTIPLDPGVYRFISAKNEILYVGKAKNLKNRLTSYFGERKDRLVKTKVMVKAAVRIEFTIVETEHDALLLEATLIKEFQPRYNVMLKDGRTYPYICVKNERFPRVFITRRVIKDGSAYFGPYVSKNQVYIILDLIKNLFPLRNCNLSLSRDNIEKSKFKVCLEYHIKNCMGPCAGFEKELDYNVKIGQIKNMLKGNFAQVKAHLKQEMQYLSEQLEFEKAQEIKNNLLAFEDYQGKSTVVSSTISNVDVFTIATDEKMAYVNYLCVVNGAIINTFTLEMTKNLDEDEDELLAFGIGIIRERFANNNSEIILNKQIELIENEIVISVPKIGDKKKLLELSEKNVQYHMLQKRKDEMNKGNKQTSMERILKTLQDDLQMSEVPMHIECFDNSNFHGSYPVSSCVVFRNAKPAKRDYRHFNVKTVVGANDFATMEEVVFRRYKRLLAEGSSLPQLIIIDGGKGQLSSAVKSLKALGIEHQVTVIGIAKQLEEIFFPDDPIPIYIDKRSESLKLIQQCRNEAHRFGITFHRDQRSRGFTVTALTDIPGIGELTANKLLTEFKSIKKLRTTNPADIEALVGKSATTKILKFFEDEKAEAETKDETIES